MNNSREIAATIVGAVIGGLAGYLFFTESGRRVRRQIELSLKDVPRDVTTFRDTVREAADVAHEGWTLLNDTLGDSARSPARHPPGQTSPF